MRHDRLKSESHIEPTFHTINLSPWTSALWGIWRGFPPKGWCFRPLALLESLALAVGFPTHPHLGGVNWKGWAATMRFWCGHNTNLPHPLAKRKQPNVAPQMPPHQPLGSTTGPLATQVWQNTSNTPTVHMGAHTSMLRPNFSLISTKKVVSVFFSVDSCELLPFLAIQFHTRKAQASHRARTTHARTQRERAGSARVA